LAGLAPKDDCPECGLPIEATTLRPLLADVAARSRLRSGSTGSPRSRARGCVLGLAILALAMLLISALLRK